LIALNDAPFLQRTNAPGDCRGRQWDTLGELDLALAAIFEKRPENRPIQRIEPNLFHFLAS